MLIARRPPRGTCSFFVLARGHKGIMVIADNQSGTCLFFPDCHEGHVHSSSGTMWTCFSRPPRGTCSFFVLARGHKGIMSTLGDQGWTCPGVSAGGPVVPPDGLHQCRPPRSPQRPGAAREPGRAKPGGVTDGTAAQTSICWRLKPGLSRAEPMAGGRNGWDDALYGKRCTD